MKSETEPMPQFGLERDYPLLYKISRVYDVAERLGESTDPLMAEVDAAMRELWNARRHLAEEATR